MLIGVDADTFANEFHAFSDVVIGAGERSRAEKNREIPVENHIKPDGTPVSVTDLLNERALVTDIRERWPGMGILSEEQYNAMPKTEMCAFVDPLDGTKEFLSRPRRNDPLYGKRWALSAGLVLLVEDGMPFAGIVAQPQLRRAFKVLKKSVFNNHAGIWHFNYETSAWEPFIDGGAPQDGKFHLATDYGRTTPPFYRQEVNQIRQALKGRIAKKRENMPAVHAGIEAFLRKISAWLSHTATPWDLAADALMLTERGGVAENLHGGPIPWATNGKGNMQVSPVLLADSQESADITRHALGIAVR